MKHILFLVLLVFCSVTFAEGYKIGIRESKPFAYKEQGKWKGSDVVMTEKLAGILRIKHYGFVEYETIPDMLEATKVGSVDMSIAALSLEAKRESYLDFSHPYLSTDIGILTNPKQNATDAIIGVVKQLLGVFLGFVVLLYLVGSFVTVLDKSNELSANDGAWWALVTFTTVGYGDVTPTSGKGMQT